MTTNDLTADYAEAKRLRWQCRRGMREMDMLLERWLDKHFSHASVTVRRHFSALLQTEDDQLWDWLMGKSAPEDQEQACLITQIRDGFLPA